MRGKAGIKECACLCMFAYVRACVCVRAYFCFLSGRPPCWLSWSRQWPSCWVGGTWCCPSQGLSTSGRRWCLSVWPLDSTHTPWRVWQVSPLGFVLSVYSPSLCFLSTLVTVPVSSISLFLILDPLESVTSFFSFL